MEEKKLIDKIYRLREELIKKLDNLEENEYIKLNYDDKIIDILLFKEHGHESLIVDEYGVYKNCLKEFAIPQKYLEKIDFSNVSFDNFFLENFDFSKLHNVKINPQKIIYSKEDMQYEDAKIIFNGVEFIGNFNNFPMYKLDFTGSKNAIIDINRVEKHRYVASVKLEDCIFSSVTFIDSKKKNKEDIKKIYIKNCDFTGSKNLILELGKIRILENTILKDVLFDDIIDSYNLNDLMIQGLDFTGARKLSGKLIKKITPVEIDVSKVCKIINSNFSDVRFISPFKNQIYLENVSFKNSSGAIIKKESINKKSKLDTVDFTDSIVLGDNGEKLTISEDGKISNEFLYNVDKLFGINHTLALKKSEDKEKKRVEEIKNKKEEVKKKIVEIMNLLQNIESLGMDSKNIYGTIPINEDLFLVKIDDHFEINRDFINAELLRFFNLSLINFENVKVSGIDFRKSNARINPQIVYKKDISNCKFDNYNISPFTDLENVNISNTDFSECSFISEKRLVRR